MAKETTNMYFWTCWYCEKSQFSEYPSIKGVRSMHPNCREKFDNEKESNLEQYVHLKVKIMHERALRMLEKQGANMNDYLEESNAVYEKALEEPSKFASSPEMVAAMELLRHEVQFKPEHKIGNRRVDFFIPDMKVVLEIDGHLHKYNKVKDSERDIEILNKLNKDDPGWEIVRIPTNRIETNVKKLLPAIKALSEYKRKTRKENNGFMPHGNSLREDEHYQELLKM